MKLTTIATCITLNHAVQLESQNLRTQVLAQVYSDLKQKSHQNFVMPRLSPSQYLYAQAEEQTYMHG